MYYLADSQYARAKYSVHKYNINVKNILLN